MLKRFGNHIKENNLGFRIQEKMTGRHMFYSPETNSESKRMEFDVVWGHECVTDFFNPHHKDFLKADLEGDVTVEGLCERTPCSGTLEIDYFGTHTIRYTFDFEVSGKNYHYEGEKVNIKPWNLLFSHTTCFGTLAEKATGILISTSVLYFRLRTIPSFLLSFRPQISAGMRKQRR